MTVSTNQNSDSGVAKGVGVTFLQGVVDNGGLAWYQDPTFKRDDTFPSLNMDFANNRYALNQSSTSLSSIVTFTRSTTASYVDGAGVIRTAAIDTPRITYDPTTYEKLGFVSESSVTNLVQRAMAPQNTYWTKVGCSANGNDTTAPDLTTTACRITEDATTGLHGYARTTSLAATIGQIYTVSCFYKPNGRTEWGLRLNATAFGSNIDAIFDCTGSGGIVSVGAGGAARITYYAAQGFYRCELTATATVAGQIQPAFGAALGGALSYTGTNLLDAGWTWGMQLEGGYYASSYISTAASPVTRSADVLLSSSIGAWSNANTGTFIANHRSYDGTGADNIPFSVNDGTTANSYEVIYTSAGNLNGRRNIASIATSSTGPAYTMGALNKTGLSYSLAGNKYAANGVLYSPIAPAAVITMTELDIGQSISATHLNGIISSLIFYPIVLADATITAATV